MPTGNLPAKAKALWEKVYEAAKAKGDSEEKAAKKAWGAVKNAGWHKKEDKWVKSSNLVEFSLRIEKASFDKPTQEMRWRMVSSDTLEDLHTDNMTLELYQDFINRIESGEQVPEEYRSEFWSGGMPYLSIAHYDDLDGEGVPGITDATYIDGNKLKARGRFHDKPLGKKCFDAICDDLYNKNSEHEDKVRVSIGFLDYSHRHKSNGYVFVRESLDDFCPECLKELLTGKGAGKEYLKGHLIHYALTRVPVNQRTIMEVDKSMAIKTRKEDAASIVGEEFADELDELQKVKSKSSALVTFSDTEDETETPESEEVVEEVSEPVVDEIKQEKSYGGATSLVDAKKVMDAQQEYWRLSDLWYMLSEVMSNIFYSEDIENKGEAIKKVVDEFKSMIDNKSLALLSQIEDFLGKTVQKSENNDVHPLDGAIAELKKDFSDAMAIEATPDEKLQLIQESYAKLGKSVVDVVKAEQKQEVQNEQPINADNSQLIQLANIVENLTQKVDLLVTQMNGRTEFTGPKVPEPRSMRLEPFNPMSQVQNPNKPMSLHDIVQRSVGL